MAYELDENQKAILDRMRQDAPAPKDQADSLAQLAARLQQSKEVEIPGLTFREGEDVPNHVDLPPMDFSSNKVSVPGLKFALREPAGVPAPVPASGPASDAQFYALGGGQTRPPMPASGPSPMDLKALAMEKAIEDSMKQPRRKGPP